VAEEVPDSQAPVTKEACTATSEVESQPNDAGGDQVALHAAKHALLQSRADLAVVQRRCDTLSGEANQRLSESERARRESEAAAVRLAALQWELRQSETEVGSLRLAVRGAAAAGRTNADLEAMEPRAAREEVRRLRFDLELCRVREALAARGRRCVAAFSHWRVLFQLTLEKTRSRLSSMALDCSRIHSLLPLCAYSRRGRHAQPRLRRWSGFSREGRRQRCSDSQ